MMEIKENNILTFYRGQEDIVVKEKANYAESLFKDQYTHALLQIHQLTSRRKMVYQVFLLFVATEGKVKRLAWKPSKLCLQI